MEDVGEYVWEEKSFKFYQAALIAILIIAGIVQLFVAFVTIRFLIQFKWRKIIFALFMISLNVSLLFRIAFLSNLIYVNRPHHWFQALTWGGTIIQYSHILFLALAGAINIYNWLSFTFSLKSLDRRTIFIRRRRGRLLHWVAPIVILIIILWYTTLYTFSWVTNNLDDFLTVLGLLDYFGLVVIGLLGISFILVGTYLK